jgi:hypothetical protein
MMAWLCHHGCRLQHQRLSAELHVNWMCAGGMLKGKGAIPKSSTAASMEGYTVGLVEALLPDVSCFALRNIGAG